MPAVNGCVFFVVVALAPVQALQNSLPHAVPEVNRTRSAALKAMRIAIEGSAHDARLSLEAQALGTEVERVQMRHQESLTGLQEACRDQLAEQYQNTLAQAQAVAKEADKVNKLLHVNAAIRAEAVTTRQILQDATDRFIKFTDNIKTLQEFVETALADTDPAQRQELESVLKRAAEEQAAENSTAGQPVVGHARRASSSNIAPKVGKVVGKAIAPKKSIRLFQAAPLEAIPWAKHSLRLFQTSPWLEAATTSQLLADDPSVDKKLEDMKAKLQQVAALSSRTQQSVVDQCSQEIAEGAMTSAQLKQRTAELVERREEQEALRQRLSAARRQLALTSSVFKSKALTFEDVWRRRTETISGETQLWANYKEEFPERPGANSDDDVSLLQVSAGTAASANKRRRRQPIDAEAAEMMEPRSSGEGEGTLAAVEDTLSHGISMGNSMQTVAARVEELQQRLAQMDVDNKQALERAKFIYARQLAKKKEENRAIAESNQKIAQELHFLADARLSLRAQANHLRNNIPAWKSDFTSLAMNFTTALEVTKKAMGNIAKQSAAPAVAILDDLDHQDQERADMATKQSKLQEIMAASQHPEVAPQTAMQTQDAGEPRTDTEESEEDEAEEAEPLALLQTTMLTQLKRAASSRNPSALLQALDTGLSDLRQENEAAKEEMKQHFENLLAEEATRHQGLLNEHNTLKASLAKSRALNHKLESAIQSLMDLDKGLRLQAQSLRAYTQQLGIRALPVGPTTHEIIPVDRQEGNADVQHKREAQENPHESVTATPVIGLAQDSMSLAKSSPAKVEKRSPPSGAAKEKPKPQKRQAQASNTKWLSWLTR